MQHGGIDEARRQVDQLIGIFGPDNVYVELQRHFQREEESRNRAAIDIARSLNLPLLATNGVCYATPKARELCDAFTAIRHHRTLSTAGRLLSRNSERFLKSRRKCSNSSPTCPKPSPTRSNFPPASNSPSTISATNSRAIPCPKARP